MSARVSCGTLIELLDEILYETNCNFSGTNNSYHKDINAVNCDRKLLILRIDSFMLKDIWAISSVEERFVYTEEAVGSIPTSPTYFLCFP